MIPTWTLRTHESQSPALPWLRLPPESSDCTGQGGCPLGSWGSLGCGGCLGLFPLLVRRLRDLKSEVWMEKALRAPARSGLRAPPGAVGGGGWRFVWNRVDLQRRVGVGRTAERLSYRHSFCMFFSTNVHPRRLGVGPCAGGPRWSSDLSASSLHEPRLPLHRSPAPGNHKAVLAVSLFHSRFTGAAFQVPRVGDTARRLPV